MYLFIKRVFDLGTALMALIALSPLFIPLVIALRLTGEGEIFYKQERVGYNRQMFGILKFATMLKNSPNMGTGDITLRDDPRVTPVGKHLRKTKLNELPQIINVLKGDLSWVGPRPLMPVSFEMYSDDVQNVVYESRPGITGLGSLVYRDEEALVSAATDAGIDPREYYQRAIYPYKGELELYYRRKRGLWTDLKILIGTALSVVLPSVDIASTLFPDMPGRPTNLDPSRYAETLAAQ